MKDSFSTLLLTIVQHRLLLHRSPVNEALKKEVGKREKRGEEGVIVGKVEEEGPIQRDNGEMVKTQQLGRVC